MRDEITNIMSEAEAILRRDVGNEAARAALNLGECALEKIAEAGPSAQYFDDFCIELAERRDMMLDAMDHARN